MKAAASSTVFRQRLIGEEAMTNGQEVIHLPQPRSSPGAVADFFGRAARQIRMGDCSRRGPGTLFSNFESTFCPCITREVALTLQRFYENIPPGLHSLCKTERLMWFIQPSIMSGQNALVCCPHILPVRISAVAILQLSYLSGLEA